MEVVKQILDKAKDIEYDVKVLEKLVEPRERILYIFVKGIISLCKSVVFYYTVREILEYIKF